MILTAKPSGYLISTVLLDLSALVLIYFIPALTHLLNFPLYLIEPMRVMLVLSLAHTGKRNAYLLALSMPLFSFLISGHPELVKMLLITIELTAAVFLFDHLTRKATNVFLPIFLSILLSKALYYLLKFVMINLSILDMQLISTPLYIQAITSVFFSLYLVKCSSSLQREHK